MSYIFDHLFKKSCSCAFGGCEYFNKLLGLKDDNLIESVIEDVIESQLGISIDLTPENSDEDDYTLDMWRKDK